jgi:hypothetical protein
MNRKFTTLGFALLLSAAMVLTAACGSGGGRGGSSGSAADEPVATSSVQVDVSFPADAVLTALGTRAQSTYSDINAIAFEVYATGDTPGVDTPIDTATDSVSGDGWSVTFTDLPVGVGLDFRASATDVGTTEIFAGADINVILTNGPESVTINMDPTGITITLPQVTSITVPAQFEVSTSDTVSFGLATTANTDLDYVITAAASGGSFAPNTNTIAVGGGGTATLNSTYTAPASVSTYEHNIRITNEGNFSVQQAFQTVVVDAVTDVDVSVQFGPVLTALLVERPLSAGVPGSNLVFTATVDDDVDAGTVTFNWSFTPSVGSSSFAVASANPATLNNYDSTVTGDLTLVLTDEDGLQTTLTYTLPAGLFFD